MSMSYCGCDDNVGLGYIAKGIHTSASIEDIDMFMRCVLSSAFSNISFLLLLSVFNPNLCLTLYNRC